MTQTIVAVYDTPAHAELAVQDLLAAGVPESAVERHAQEGTYAGRATAPAARSTEGQGFWSGLFGGEPDHDTTVYDRSVQGGSQRGFGESAGRARDARHRRSWRATTRSTSTSGPAATG